MSRPLPWRCWCAREVGTIRWRGGVSVLKLARSVEDVLVSPGCVAAVCPACGLAVAFESRSDGGFVTTMATTQAAS